MPRRCAGLLLALGLAACAPTTGAVKPVGVSDRIACPARAGFEVDTGAVTSKYIGETEKNLSRAFAGKEMSASPLTFDEADALFGKRSEVKDSHDRYANLEISCLSEKTCERLRGLPGRAFISGFSPRAPKKGVIVLEAERGLVLLHFDGPDEESAISLARAFARACGPF